MLLFQGVPTAAFASELAYAIPAGQRLQLDSLIVCNQAGAATYRLRIAKRGEELPAPAVAKQYLQFGTAILANDTQYLTGFTPTAGDVIYMSANVNTFSFSIWGSLIPL